MLNRAIESLKTEFAVASQVARGQAFVETLVPRKRNRIDAFITRTDGTVEHLSPSFNARVDAGANAQAQLMGNGSGTAFNYLALSTTSLTIAKGDTVLSGEITSASNSGLARAQATYGTYTAPSSLGGSASYVLSKTFTSSGSTTVNSAALFNAASGGTMFTEINLSAPATLNSGDSLTITYTISI